MQDSKGASLAAHDVIVNPTTNEKALILSVTESSARLKQLSTGSIFIMGSSFIGLTKWEKQGD